jgi:hypothetical protein
LNGCRYLRRSNFRFLVLHNWRAQSFLVRRIRCLAPVFDGGKAGESTSSPSHPRLFGTALVARVGERFENRGVAGRTANVLGRTAGNETPVSLSFCARALRRSLGRCRSTLSPLLNAPADHSPLLRRTGGARRRDDHPLPIGSFCSRRAHVANRARSIDRQPSRRPKRRRGMLWPSRCRRWPSDQSA